MEFLPIVIIVGIALFAGGALIMGHLMEKKRLEAFEAAANELGLAYTAGESGNFLTQLDPFELFNKGHSKKLTNLIQAETEEVRISVFDYKYTTGSGKNQSTSKQTVVSLESPRFNLPTFKMRPEGMFDKVGSALGFQDIDFETHPDFSNLFVLQGPNEEQIRKFFDDKLLTFFEGRRGLNLEAKSSGALIFYRSRKRIKAEEIRSKLEEAYEIFGMMTESAATQQ